MDLDLSDDQSEIVNDEIGCNATLSNGEIIRCIFRNQYASGDVQSLSIEGNRPYARCLTSDVSNVAQGQTFTIGETEYKIDEIQPDDTGWTVIILYKQNS